MRIQPVVNKSHVPDSVTVDSKENKIFVFMSTEKLAYVSKLHYIRGILT